MELNSGGNRIIMTKEIFHYRAEMPDGMTIDEARKWCSKHCDGKIKIKYSRKYDNEKKRYVRDYISQPKIKFTEECDAMHFKLLWT